MTEREGADAEPPGAASARPPVDVPHPAMVVVAEVELETEPPVGPGVHTFRELDRWPQWACASIIAVFTLLPFASGILLATDDWVATGDVAIIGIRSYDAWTVDAPLVGQPTTGEEAVGVASSHPGPIENWIVGPFVRALGPQLGLLMGIAAINSASLGVTLWLAFRRDGPVLLALTAIFLALLVHALGAPSLTDAFNSELPTYPTLAAVLAAWSVVRRDLVAAPILVVAASVATQPHLVGGSSVALPVLVAMGAIVVQLVRRQHRLHRALGPLLMSLALVVLCWAPPAAQELSAGPSNLAALTETSRASLAPLGLIHTAERVVTALAPPPTWVRSGYSLDALAPRSGVAVVLAALVLGGAGSLAVFHRQRGRTGLVSLWLLANASMLGAAALASRSPTVRALRFDTNRWLWTSGFLIWLSLLWSLGRSVANHRRRGTEGLVALLGLVVALSLAGSMLASSSDTSHMRDARYLAPTAALNQVVLAEVPRGHYRLELGGPPSSIVVGPALAYALVADGYELSVGGGFFDRRFGHDRNRPTPSGSLDGTIAVVDLPPDAAAPEGKLVARVTIPAERENEDDVSIAVVLR